MTCNLLFTSENCFPILDSEGVSDTLHYRAEAIKKANGVEFSEEVLLHTSDLKSLLSK